MAKMRNEVPFTVGAKCPGCGSIFQTHSPDRSGYIPPNYGSTKRPPSVHALIPNIPDESISGGITPSELRKAIQKDRSSKTGGIVCQRCHRLQNYGEVTVKDNIDYEAVYNRIRLSSDSVIVLVADAADLPWSLFDNVARYVGDKACILAVNKVDVLPKKFSTKSLEKWIKSETERNGFPAWQDIIFTSAKTGDGIIELTESIKRIRQPGSNVNFIGRPNVGKSKLIKALLRLIGDDYASTVSHLPGTTVSTISFPMSRFKTIFDYNE
ncbi:P-loop containing nucleoside triphosphate hydrolase protein, partial [Chytridium lagenaria]